jgi:type I restriction enzyme M protein
MADARSSVSLAEIAAFAGVTVAAVSNWRRRYDDFPSPVPTEGRESFLAADVARWLDRRKISQNLLGKSEPDGSSYGDRFRRNTGMTRNHEVRAPDIGQMLWRQLERLRGVLDVAAFSDLVLTLLYIRGGHSQVWSTLVERAYAGPYEVERAISDALAADDWLRDFSSSLTGTLGQTDSHHLRSIIHAIDRISPRDQEIASIIVPAFSDLLARFAAAKGRKGGEFYTPKSIVNLAVQLLAPSLKDQIFDPCCGTGEFLTAAVDYLRRQGGDAADLSVSGSGLTAQTCRLAYMNLYLRGLIAPIRPDAISTLERGLPDHHYDLVITNPPFNMSDWSHDGGMLGHWRYGPPPQHNANFAWLQFVLSSLKPSGRAVVIMPNGASFSENSQEREIRTAMLEDGAVSAVIALPPNLFVPTAIPVTMWILQYPDASRKGDVLFIDATELGTLRERTRRILDDGDIDKIVQVYVDWRARSVTGSPGFAASADLDTIRQTRYRLNPREYVSPPSTLVDRAEAVGAVNHLRQTLHRLQQQAAQMDAVVDQQLERIQL